MQIRIQIAIGSKLTAECIVENYMVDKTWAAYARAKYRAGKPIGGAVMQRADLPRFWDVRVGSYVTH